MHDPQSMTAVRYAAYGEAPTLTELPIPDCPPDGVLIEVRATGVCRSDWHAWQGHDPVPLPMLPGHEFAGTIAAVGPAVRRRQVGERVTVPFACGCGRPACAYCTDGDTHVCPHQTQPGFTGWGSFAEVVAVQAADANVVPLPDSVGFVEAASLGCRFATAYRAVVSLGRLAAGEWLAVFGCGGVGLSAVQIGVALGARVVAVDTSTAALATARDLGAEGLVLVPDPSDLASVVARVRRLTVDGAHVSLDALGSPATAHASLDVLRRRGRQVQVGLLLGDDADLLVPMGRVIAQELEILGGHGMPARDYPAMLDLVASGALDPSLLVGRVITLAEAPAALMAMSEPPTHSGMTVIEIPTD